MRVIRQAVNGGAAVRADRRAARDHGAVRVPARRRRPRDPRPHHAAPPTVLDADPERRGVRRRLRGVRQRRDRPRRARPARPVPDRVHQRVRDHGAVPPQRARAPTAAGATRSPTHRGYEDWNLWMDLAQDGRADRAPATTCSTAAACTRPGWTSSAHAATPSSTARCATRTRGCSPSSARTAADTDALDAAQAALPVALRRAPADQPRPVREAATRPGRRLDAARRQR